MATLPAPQRDAIAKLLEQRKVEDAFAKLEAHPDLKQNDLPTLEKRALAALGEDRAAARAFVAGLLAPSGSVRRMARKYTPKIAPHGPDEAVRLLVECARPFRKLKKGEEGLAGNFGGWATPLGRSVVDAKLSFEVKNPTVAVYSEASRVLKDAFENLAETVSMLDDPLVVRAYEFSAALRRPFARLDNMPLPDDLPEMKNAGLYFSVAVTYDALKQEMAKRLKKGSPLLLRALERWARHEMFLDDEAAVGSLAADLRAHWHQYPEEQRKYSAAVMPMCAGDYIRWGLEDAKAIALYWHLVAGPKPPTPAHEWVLNFTLERVKREKPRETSGKVPSPLPTLAPPETTADAPAPAKGKKAEPAAPAAPATVADAPPPFEPYLGPPADHALGTLVGVAEGLGLPVLWKELVKEAEHSWLTDGDAPRPAKDPGDAEDVIRAVRETIKAAKSSKARDKIAVSVMGSFSEGEGKYVAEEALASAPWAERFAELVAGLESGSAALDAALQLVSPRLLAKHKDAWRKAATKLDERMGHKAVRSAIIAASTRGAGLGPILGPILEWKATQWGPHSDSELAYLLAILYTAHGPEGRAAAARAVAASKLATPGGHYRRHTSTDPWRYVFRQAWERRDADLLGAAFARVVVPLYFKGKKAFIPHQEHYKKENMAPVEGTAPADKELPLAEVAAFVAKERPQLLAEALTNAGECASYEKGARAILDAAPDSPTFSASPVGAPTPVDDKRVADVIALLEAPKAPVVKNGLEMLLPLAPTLGSKLDDVFRGLERAVASASPGVLQAAAALLGALAVEHAERRADAVQLLEECLMAKNIPTAEEAMRALQKALDAKGKQAAKLSATAKKRVKELALEEPKRLGKLAKGLLG